MPKNTFMWLLMKVFFPKASVSVDKYSSQLNWNIYHNAFWINTFSNFLSLLNPVVISVLDANFPLINWIVSKLGFLLFMDSVQSFGLSLAREILVQKLVSWARSRKPGTEILFSPASTPRGFYFIKIIYNTTLINKEKHMSRNKVVK